MTYGREEEGGKFSKFVERICRERVCHESRARAWRAVCMQHGMGRGPNDERFLQFVDPLLLPSVFGDQSCSVEYMSMYHYALT